MKPVPPRISRRIGFGRVVVAANERGDAPSIAAVDNCSRLRRVTRILFSSSIARSAGTSSVGQYIGVNAGQDADHSFCAGGGLFPALASFPRPPPLDSTR